MADGINHRKYLRRMEIRYLCGEQSVSQFSAPSKHRGGPMRHERSVFFVPMLVLLSLIVVAFRAEAASYTVKASGGNYTSIGACANAAGAGDTCTVFAGSYGGWTQSNSGSAGKPITFTVNPGDTVTITSGVTISSQSYITISHFTFSSGGITGNGSTSHNIIDHNTFNGAATAFNIPDGLGSNGSDNVFSNNTIKISSTSNIANIYLYGNRNRIEFNTISGGDGDCMDIGGTNVVVRGNSCTNKNGGSGEHIDFVQVMGGGTSPTLSFSLVEENTEQNCSNDGGNCHFIIVRTGSGPVADTVIVRSNYAQNLDGTGASFGGLGDNVPHPWFYNNTMAAGRVASESGDCASYQNAPYSGAFNNICYNNGKGPYFGIGGCGSGLTGFCNGNIEFNTGYSGSWDAPYSGEATYAALHNQDPSFANFPADATLQSGSPAKNAGVALTTASGSGSNSTALTVADAHGFQPGWAGTQPDGIRIGSSTTAQISSINYTTNVITLANPASWNKGDGVYLYKDSSGNVVLNGSNPDIGAFDLKNNGNPPPNGLQLVVH
jgi:hypothetical protein